MKAIVYEKFGPPEVLHLKEVEKPSPKENEVLVRIHAATVVKEDPDWRRSPGFNGFLRPRHPILGQEFAGVVETAGSGATRFQSGEQVFGIVAYGTYAEYISLPEDAALTAMPATLTFAEAASIPNGTLTALHFLRDKGSVRPGQRVLINGASGSVGSAAVQLARYYGAEVTGVCSTANLEMVKALGADHVIDYTRADFAENGRTYDVIFDTVGKRKFGDSRGSLTENGIFLATVPTPALMLRSLWPVKRGKRPAFGAAGLRKAREKISDLDFLRGLIEAGQFRPVIDRVYPLVETAEAHRYVETGRKRGNVVISVVKKAG